MTRTPRTMIAFVVACLVALGADAAAQSLTAGDVDDHLNWDHYLEYLDRFGQEQTPLPSLSFGERATLRIVDRDGDPLGDAHVTVATNGGNVSLRSGMDGLVRVLPVADGLGAGGPATVIVTAPDGTTKGFEVDLAAAGPHVLSLETDATGATALDMMFVIDTTGSMSDELAYLTNELGAIVADVEAAHPNVSIRFGLIVYRDTTDDYTVRDLGFTDDLQTMQTRLAGQEARGGGDYPEAMDEALGAAVDAGWRQDAVRLLFLVADAPPHVQGYDPMLDAAMDARHAGIHIHPLAASGVANEAEYLMRAAAVLTQGRYLFLTDDSGLGNAHAEPSIPCYVVTSLDDLLVRVVASELSGTRVEPDPQDVIRETGDYEMGVCLGDPDPQQQSDTGGESEGGTGSDPAGESDASGPSSDDDRSPTTVRSSYAGTEGDGAAEDITGLHRTGGGGDDAPTDPGEPEDEATPAPWPMVALLCIGLAAAWTRRRS